MMVALFAQVHHPATSPGFISYLIVAVATVVVAWIFYLAIRATFAPGETDPDHIKRTILEDSPERSDE